MFPVSRFICLLNFNSGWNKRCIRVLFLWGAARFKPVQYILPALLVLAVTACGPRKAPREHSRKVLRAFDNELIQLSGNLSSTKAFEALMLLRSLPGVQLPFISVNDTIPGTETEIFTLRRAKGVYRYSTGDSLVVKTADSDSLIVFFDDKDNPGKLFKLVISAWKETMTAFGMVFPEMLEASLFMDDRRIGEVHYQAVFKHGFPAEISMVGKSGKYAFDMELETRFRRTKSVVQVKFEIQDGDRSLIKGRIDSDVVRTAQNTLAYHDKRIELEIFPLKVILDSDYRFPQSDTMGFFEGFNRHSRIRLTDNEGASLGEVKLVQVPGRSRVNLMMHYNDGSSENAEDFLLSVRKIMNMKTSSSRW